MKNDETDEIIELAYHKIGTQPKILKHVLPMKCLIAVLFFITVKFITNLFFKTIYDKND